jgi:integrase/recombinase XerD
VEAATVKFSAAIDLYVADQQRAGRINSPNTIAAYRAKLDAHCDDVSGRDPAKTGREDVKTTLRRWPHPNSQRQAHAVLTSFYDWTMEEGIRETNPARQVRRARARSVSVYRPTRDEVVRLMDAADAAGRRERWVVHLGVLAGLRRQELTGLQGRHLAHEGWVWVSADIAKGGKARWVPVLSELEPVVAEIRALTHLSAYVVPSRRSADPPHHTILLERSETRMSGSGMYQLVRRVGVLAQLGAEIGPHTLRHAFGDHVARYAGLRAAQALLGHASVATTEGSYVGRVSRDELAVSVAGFSYHRIGAPQRQLEP